ncbi:restriction endonuclease [Rothia kristinae]|uniref:restriction endonuclease n=1 Tax=Rothia kristinae TaxID=37923 RepID=UPI0033F8C84E
MSTAETNQPTSLLPQWWGFVHPLLTVMTDGATRSLREIERAVVEHMDLSQEARAETLDSGGSRLTDRIRWAVTYTHRADFLERVARGQYRLSATGSDWLARHPEPFTTSREANQTFKPFWEKPAGTADLTPATASPGRASATPEEPVEDAATGASPVERIESAVGVLDQDVAAELLTRLRGADPAFFEEAVVKVLLAMGYGGAEQRGRRIGGTGDGGVDGVIDQDALGLDQIYVQAKRYAEGNTVGRETIQAFVGALQGRGTSRGVFITSSSFTSRAIDYAQTIPTRVILIDGARLANLMIKYRVGVQVQRTYHVVEIDEDFFE